MDGRPAGANGKKSETVREVSDEELLALRPLKPRKKATFECPTPSNYCHICSRTPNRGIRLAVCAGIRDGHCRKVVCERCFEDHPLGLSFEEASAPGADWKCTHCQQTCPQRAQCRTYQTVNRKLRLQRLRQSVASTQFKCNIQQPPSNPNRTFTLQNMPTTLPKLPPREARLQSRSVPFTAPVCALKDQRCMAAKGSTRPALSEERQGQSASNDCEGSPADPGVQANQEEQYAFKGDTSVGINILQATRTPNGLAKLKCHVCGQSPVAKDANCFQTCERAEVVSCGNLFCNNCSAKYQSIHFSLFRARESGERWSCSHCTGTCPAESQCHNTRNAFPTTSVAQKTLPLSIYIQRKRPLQESLKNRLLAATVDRIGNASHN